MDEFLIHNYHFRFDKKFSLNIPREAIILNAGMQGAFPVMWAIFSKKNENKFNERRFRLYRTGQAIRVKSIMDLKHISTFNNKAPTGNFLWHLFEEL